MDFNKPPSTISFQKYREFISLFFEGSPPSEYLNFIDGCEVVEPKRNIFFAWREGSISVDLFFGASKNDRTDLLMINDAYEGRVSDNYIAIGLVDEVDFVCLGEDGRVYLWQREINDLYFDEKNADSYKEQKTELVCLSSDFSVFLDNLSYDDQVVSGKKMEAVNAYRLASIPFEDNALDVFFKFPNLFFKQNEDAIIIQLEKLTLSDKGKRLLEIFKEKKLLE